LKKYLRYTVKGLAVLVGVFLFVYIAAYAYVVLNKKSILQEIKEQVAAKLNGDVKIGDISLGFLTTFPHISVLLENVSVKDTLFNQHHHPFFEGEKIYLNLSVTNIIQKKSPVNGIRIEKGQLYVYTDTSGYTNAYLFSPKNNKNASKKPASENEIDYIKLRRVRLVLNDLKKRKLYDFDVTKFNCDIKTTDSALRFKTKNDVLIHSLAFNTNNGSFVKEARFEGNFNVFFNKIRRQLSFNDLDISIKDHPFKISGIFDFAKAKTFFFKVTTRSIDYDLAKSLLTEKNSKALSVVKLEKPIDEITAEVSGRLNGGTPLVNAIYTCRQNNVKSAYGNFSNCIFSGSYTNEFIKGEPRTDINSRLQFHNFTGEWEGLTIKSQNIYLDNLEVPLVNADIKTDFDLTQLNTLIGSSTLDFHEGKGLLDVKYTGPLKENTKTNTLLNGKCTFSNGILMYHPRGIEVKNLNGNITFKSSDVYVNDFRGNVQGNKIIMNGSGKNLLALMKTNPGKMSLDWNVYSPSLNLGSFTSLLKTRVTAVRKKNSKSRIGNNIDQIISQANFNLNLKTDQLTYKRFTATNVKASLGMANENWILNNVSLNHGGGSMVISGNLNAKNTKYFESNIKVNMENVDVNKVFYAFNNFGQNGISSENLRGKLTSSADVKMDIDRDLSGTPKNMEGFIDFSLKKGALLHYDPLLKVQQIAFKKRNFDEIYFAELKDRFDIKDREIVINRMEIESTVLTLFVEGVYSLRGNTDISLQVPLNNMKKREEDYKPENKGPDAKAGASVYIRGRPGDDGNIKFKLDLFRKFRGKGDKEKSGNVFKD
jgi:hypothetical protein